MSIELPHLDGVLLLLVKVASADAVPEPSTYQLLCVVRRDKVVRKLPVQFLILHLKGPTYSGQFFRYMTFTQNPQPGLENGLSARLIATPNWRGSS